MVMASSLGQNDEIVRFPSLGGKAGSAFPDAGGATAQGLPLTTGRWQYRQHNKRDIISVLH
jgi:hypothetical protein